MLQADQGHGFYFETERLILRSMAPEDADGFFEMDSDPEVHTYLGNNPVKDMDEIMRMIASVQQQYIDNGIGRWSVIEKSTGSFAGWSGLKFMSDPKAGRDPYYDIGYRFAKKYWGKGYATESAMVALDYGFTEMKLEEIIGTAHEQNARSKRVLEKCGLRYVKKFGFMGIPCDWLSITRETWIARSVK